MPAGAVNPVPIAYIKVDADKKLVVGFLVQESVRHMHSCWCQLSNLFCEEDFLSLSCREI